jgi:hypothetical protein
MERCVIVRCVTDGVEIENHKTKESWLAECFRPNRQKRIGCCHSTCKEDRNMSAIQSWSGLPEHIKRQAAPDMLRGVQWQFWGVPVMNPGKAELLRWVPAPFRQALGLPEGVNEGDLKRTSSALEKRQTPTPTLAETSPPTVYRSNRDKGRDVEAALRADSAKSNREIARATGTSHPFVAKVRRKLESVTS